VPEVLRPLMGKDTIGAEARRSAAAASPGGGPGGAAHRGRLRVRRARGDQHPRRAAS